MHTLTSLFIIYVAKTNKKMPPNTRIFNYLFSFFPLCAQWITFCQSLLKEARWFNMKYTPTIDEHTHNGANSSSGPLMSIHIFFALVPKTEQQQIVDILKSTAEYEQNVGLIFRLCNDLGNYAVILYISDNFV